MSGANVMQLQTERHFTQGFLLPNALRVKYFASGRLGVADGQRYDYLADLPYGPVRAGARARGRRGACTGAVMAMVRNIETTRAGSRATRARRALPRGQGHSREALKSASAAQMEGNRGFRFELQRGEGCIPNETSRVLGVVLMSSGSVKVPDAK